MIIAVDFDGTVVTHAYPRIGHDIGAVPVLKELVDKGHKLILWTMRADGTVELDEAVEWFRRNGIDLYAVNRNPMQHWSNSPKAFAHLYIDDMALGAPLIRGKGRDRSYVDWATIRELLMKEGVL